MGNPKYGAFATFFQGLHSPHLSVFNSQTFRKMSRQGRVDMARNSLQCSFSYAVIHLRFLLSVNEAASITPLNLVCANGVSLPVLPTRRSACCAHWHTCVARRSQRWYLRWWRQVWYACQLMAWQQQGHKGQQGQGKPQCLLTGRPAIWQTHASGAFSWKE